MLSDRFTQALILAAELHATQLRKGTNIPYLSHLLGVVSLALEQGADENEAIAALLHDAVEDQGGIATLNRIRTQFGEPVALLVEGCSDTLQTPKPPWKIRKEAYLEHLRHTSSSVRLISACDKLHNARAILADLRVHGNALWSRFSSSPDEILWYYRTLVTTFQATSDSPLIDELDRTVCEIEILTAQTRESSASKP
jgi:(p)ppGpp synthase/HD superfamily hydrolase